MASQIGTARATGTDGAPRLLSLAFALLTAGLIGLAGGVKPAAAHFTPSTLNCFGDYWVGGTVICQLTIIPTHNVSSGDLLTVTLAEGLAAEVRFKPAGVGVVPGGSCGYTGGGSLGEGPVVLNNNDLDFTIYMDRVACPGGGSIQVWQDTSRVSRGDGLLPQSIASARFGSTHTTTAVGTVPFPQLCPPWRCR
jgi:hypothetical protein